MAESESSPDTSHRPLTTPPLSGPCSTSLEGEPRLSGSPLRVAMLERTRRPKYQLSLESYIASYLSSCLEVHIIMRRDIEFVVAFGHAYSCYSGIVGAVPVWSTRPVESNWSALNGGLRTFVRDLYCHHVLGCPCGCEAEVVGSLIVRDFHDLGQFVDRVGFPDDALL
jgi:hypothetical protein